MSRTPLRAALQRLQQEGFVVSTPTARRSRLVVAPMTLEDARELFHVVGALESLAAREASRADPASRQRLADDLEAINDAFQRASKARHPDHDRLWQLDERYHRAYVEAGAGPRLLALHDAVKPQAERYERVYVSMLTTEIATSVREHRKICRAIREGQAQVAHDAVQTNWRNAAERLGRVIARAGERGYW